MQYQIFTPSIPIIGNQWQTLFPLGQAQMLRDVFELRAHICPFRSMPKMEINIPVMTDGTIIFTQLAPAAVWTINHNTGQFPSVTTVDPTGNEVQGAVQYINSNQITVTFSSPFAGRAFLNV
jgi:hypothetical protein